MRPFRVAHFGLATGVLGYSRGKSQYSPGLVGDYSKERCLCDFEKTRSLFKVGKEDVRVDDQSNVAEPSRLEVLLGLKY